MNAQFLSEKFAAAFPYVKYVGTGTAEQQRRWQAVYSAAHLRPEQKEMIEGFVREMKVLVVSGIWCGDCVQQVPLLERIAEVNRRAIDLRILDRDQHRDLAEQVRINGGDRVPVVLLLSEDYEFCALAGDRSLARYRALAHTQLGAACPIGIEAPDSDELAQTLQDWVNAHERVQLMLRLSHRLREKHGD